MARKKLSVSKEVVKAEQRMNGSKSIDPALDLGNGLKMSGFQTLLATHHTDIDDYNETLSSIDQKKNKAELSGKAVTAFSERWLKAVGVKYGFDSDEYEMAGGTRKSEYKKPTKKTPPNP